ncbi:MAG: 3-phosphoshikimate 1-carboxyvinyltransferase [Solobacterium sp.]|nr:3-phosphoshikimate 1-carboxyvinyltransferase [Solobacterium sp.]
MKLRLGYHPVSSWQVSVPAGKSQSHRALIMAALADGTSTLERLPDNDDVNATRKCLEQLGAVFETTEDHVTVHGIGGHLPEGELRLDCGASGSTLRFMIALAGMRSGKTIFTGTDRLLARPLDEYRGLFTGQGLVFDHDGTRLIVAGGLHGKLFSVSGERSSQFVSGLLMALPLMKEDTALQVSGPLQSASYVDLTEQYLSLAGIRYQRQDHCWQIPGNQTYQPLHAVIGPDVSSAAPFAVLAAMTKSEVLISGLKAETKHPDMRVFDILQDMGAEVSFVSEGCLVRGRELQGCTVDLGDCPDLGPVLFVLAGAAAGATRFIHAGRLRYKESDRLAVMAEELAKCGIAMTVLDDEVMIEGQTPQQPETELDCHRDHRIAMALSLMTARLKEPVVLAGTECIAKSYPDYFAVLENSGIVNKGMV